MKPQYLTNINTQPSTFPGLEILSLGDSTWYAGDYTTVKSNKFKDIKKEIVELINFSMNRKTIRKDWDWHHVVETQHISQFIEGVKVHQEEWHNMPTILIHKPEHKFFSQNFNNNAFRELTDTQKGRVHHVDLHKKQNTAQLKQVKTTIKNLQDMYNSMYSGYTVLRKIANNVFNYHLRSL